MAETRLTLASGGLMARVLGALGMVQERPEKPPAGAAGVTGPDYDPLHALSAMAAYAFVQACVLVRVNDLQSLPWYIQEGPENGGRRIDVHPMLERLREPNLYDDGRWLHGQVQADQLLTGNGYLLRIGEGRLAHYVRMHPQGVQVAHDKHYRPTAYTTSTGEAFGSDRVVHHRRLSWQDAGKVNIGTGIIQALERRLVALREAERMQAKQARLGKKDAVMTPAQQGQVQGRWSRQQVTELTGAIKQALTNGSPYLVLGEGMDITTLSATAEELGFIPLDNATRQDIMAAFSVPPIKLGLDSTNYATAREQRREYWRSLVSESAWHEDTWTREGRRAWGLKPNQHIRRDFSRVEALQADALERATVASTRAMAAQTYYFLGYTAEQALTLAGHSDPPAPKRQLEQPARVGEVAPPVRVSRSLADDEAARSAAWERRVRERQDPAAERILKVMEPALREQGERLAAALVEERSLTSRTLVSMLGRLLGGEELARIFAALRQALTPEYLRAYSAAASEVGVELTSPDGEDATRLANLAAQQLHQYTTRAVRELVEQGLQDGLSVQDIAQQLREAHAFSPARALATARTEGTRVTERASVRAYQAAADQGVQVRVMWLSSRDASVRDAHRRLDGVTVEPGGYWSIGDDRAQAPGGFSRPENSINCRCTTIAQVIRDDEPG